MLYPIGIQDFEKIRTDGYLYVDKTAHIHRLAHSGAYYFLSRPRRFGKSLLLSTMKAYFSGKRELFHGLAMEKLEQHWTQYPILYLDLNSGKYTTAEELYDVLSRALSEWEEIYGRDASATTCHARFQSVVRRACEQTGKRVVILVDEYDKPLLQAIGDESLQNEYRSTLKAFYSILKTQDQYIQFAFLTGVTKFGKISVFSDLNNLQDISMLHDYTDICGITQQEIHTYLQEPIHLLAERNALTYEQTCTKLREQYDGYHFEVDSPGLYNPFSLLSTLSHKQFKDYWFETGTPSFLVELLKQTDYPLEELQRTEVEGDVLNSIDTLYTDPIPVIYQSGYLTIKEYNPEFGTYRLGFPNKEVEQGFVRYLMPHYTPSRPGRGGTFSISQFVTDVRSGHPEQFMQRLQAFFADGDYQVAGKKELYFQNCMWVIFKMMGFYTEVERHTAHGRVDVLIQTPNFIYAMEIKLDGSAEEALRQIEEKGYTAPFACDSRHIFHIGVNFCGDSRTIESYIIRPLRTA